MRGRCPTTQHLSQDAYDRLKAEHERAHHPRPHRHRPQDPDGPRARRPLRERRLPRGQGGAGQDGGAHPPPRRRARERRDRRRHRPATPWWPARSWPSATRATTSVERYLIGSIEERRDDLEVMSPGSPLGGRPARPHAVGDVVEYEAPGGVAQGRDRRHRVVSIEPRPMSESCNVAVRARSSGADRGHRDAAPAARRADRAARSGRHLRCRRGRRARPARPRWCCCTAGRPPRRSTGSPRYPHLARQFDVVAIDHRGHGRGHPVAPAVPARGLRRRRGGPGRRARHRPLRAGRLLDGRPGRPAHLAPPPRPGQRAWCCAPPRRRSRPARSPASGSRRSGRSPRPPGCSRTRGSALAARERFITRRAEGPWQHWISSELAPSDPTTMLEAGAALGTFNASHWARHLTVPSSVVVTTRDSVVAPASQRAPGAGAASFGDVPPRRRPPRLLRRARSLRAGPHRRLPLGGPPCCHLIRPFPEPWSPPASRCPTCGSDVPAPTTARAGRAVPQRPRPRVHRGRPHAPAHPHGEPDRPRAPPVVLAPGGVERGVGARRRARRAALSLPQHQINVAFSVFIGIGAGLGAGRLSRAYRSLAADLAALLIVGVIMLGVAAVVNHQYLIWAQGHVSGVPRSPRWDGVVGSVRLVFDRASARYGWSTNSSYFYWRSRSCSPRCWPTSPRRRRPDVRDRDEALRPGAVPQQPRVPSGCGHRVAVATAGLAGRPLDRARHARPPPPAAPSGRGTAALTEATPASRSPTLSTHSRREPSTLAEQHPPGRPGIEGQRRPHGDDGAQPVGRLERRRRRRDGRPRGT